ncbi:M35 family metallo-endopeptidase [Massilia glaciei]|uniref:Peptidase M35 n=1 Tax=Massilia glaciei TaxID=1524097 RepID=A0A2U2HGQ7_9BURK|nr:M35 family metallo-endopeptidase [Massilia glaciei]PWF44362.1 peptidase M35 [Massilia glaciei]
MNWNTTAKTSIAVMIAAMCASAQAGNNGVTVSVAAEKTKLSKSDDVVVKVTIKNTSSSPQYVLKWYTPFAEIEESLFKVTRDGVDVPYEGAHYKRQAPKATDYYVLKPGASHTTKVELSSMYDMSITGAYSISYDTKSLSMFNDEMSGNKKAKKEIGEMKSTPASLWIDGSLPRGTLAKAPAPQPPSTMGLSFTKCTASQQSTVTAAIAAGLNMATNSDAYMSGSLGARYTKWFGAADSTRAAKVKGNFASIKDAFANKPVTVDCGCKKTYYAYVYPSQPYKIYVCKAFWSAPMTGTDSKGGTMVHEMSHFTAVAGTDDWVYGQSGAASLAISDPNKAVDNADSHEYFAENTPNL